MNWKDLKIGVKIGFGFLIMIIIAAIIGLTAFLSTQKIQHETQKLSDEYIPLINETFVIDQSWIEITKLMQGYDLSGDEYYIKKAQTKFIRFNNAITKILEITEKSETLMSIVLIFFLLKNMRQRLEKY
jgi:methyl-accepting chemotaxis protein